MPDNILHKTMRQGISKLNFCEVSVLNKCFYPIKVLYDDKFIHSFMFGSRKTWFLVKVVEGIRPGC